MFGFGKFNVLAIGSVHLDTIAVRPFGDVVRPTDTVVETGNIAHGIGGNAFNIASNLSRHDFDDQLSVAIYTILPKYSLLTQIFDYKINAADVDDRFVTRMVRIGNQRTDQRVRGGGFVTIIDQENVTRLAVIDSAMHETDLFQKNQFRQAYKALEWSDAIIIDADLSVHTVDHIEEHAHAAKKPLFVSLGSRTAAKTSWLINLVDHGALSVSGHKSTILDILQEAAPDTVKGLVQLLETGVNTGVDVEKICSVFHTKCVVCCCGSTGFGIISNLLSRGQARFIDVSDETRNMRAKRTIAGVSDAGYSAFIAMLLKSESSTDATIRYTVDLENDKEFKQLEKWVRDYVSVVLTCEGATPGAVINFEEDEAALGRISTFRRALEMTLAIIPVHKYVGFLIAGAIAVWLLNMVVDLEIVKNLLGDWHSVIKGIFDKMPMPRKV